MKKGLFVFIVAGLFFTVRECNGLELTELTKKPKERPALILENPTAPEKRVPVSYKSKFYNGGRKVFGNKKRNLIGAVALIITVIIGYFVKKK